MIQLKMLVERCCEALALWELLCEHQFEQIMERLDPVSRANFFKFVFSRKSESSCRKNIVLRRRHEILSQSPFVNSKLNFWCAFSSVVDIEFLSYYRENN